MHNYPPSVGACLLTPCPDFNHLPYALLSVLKLCNIATLAQTVQHCVHSGHFNFHVSFRQTICGVKLPALLAVGARWEGDDRSDPT